MLAAATAWTAYHAAAVAHSEQKGGPGAAKTETIQTSTPAFLKEVENRNVTGMQQRFLLHHGIDAHGAATLMARWRYAEATGRRPNGSDFQQAFEAIWLADEREVAYRFLIEEDVVRAHTSAVEKSA